MWDTQSQEFYDSEDDLDERVSPFGGGVFPGEQHQRDLPLLSERDNVKRLGETSNEHLFTV